MRLRNLRLIMALAIPLAVSDCGLNGDCTYESRAALAGGQVTEDNGLQFAHATVHIGATRGSSNKRTLTWDIIAQPLAGHILSVALTDASQPGVIVLELPFLTQFEPAIISGVLEQEGDAPTPALGGIFELVVSNQAVLEVRTDIPSRPLVRIPLTVSEFEHDDWHRPFCG